MSERPGASRRGIEIPAEIADAAGVPEDLDADDIGEYAVPDTHRRRTAGVVYAVAALAVAAAALAGLSSAMWVLAAALLAVAAYHWAAGAALAVREHRALHVANQQAGFPVGHASATLGFEGFLARPVWNVLVFSADDPPTRRGLVRVSALSGAVLDRYMEDIDRDV